MRKSRSISEEIKEKEDMSTEFKIWAWLERYWKILASIVAVVVCTWASCLLVRWYQRKRVQHYLAQYEQQKTLSEQLQWAEKTLPQGLKSLQGFTFLEKANDDFSHKNYLSAVHYYQKAMQYLTIFPLLEQAQLGYAFSNIYVFNVEEAEKTFLNLVCCSSDYIRAQVFYALSYIAYQKNDSRAFDDYCKELARFPEGDAFLSQLNILKIVDTSNDQKKNLL
ncbi:MAG: hypothetical protein LBB19_00415 [Puniceicoccales bacterium]|jgi:hypothetical protein|nr:hypothetical protein [Puniceicoccales bacterium]